MISSPLAQWNLRWLSDHADPVRTRVTAVTEIDSRNTKMAYFCIYAFTTIWTMKLLSVTFINISAISKLEAIISFRAGTRVVGLRKITKPSIHRNIDSLKPIQPSAGWNTN